MPLKNRSICVTYLKENVKFPIAHMHKVQVLFKQFWCLLHGTKNTILQLSFESQSSLYIFLFICLFFFLLVFVSSYLLSYWNLFAVMILAIKAESYLHISNMQLFDYLCIYNITYMT